MPLSVQAQEPTASEMPEMGKELKKLNKACSSVINNSRKGNDIDKDMQKVAQAYDAVSEKTPGEIAAANYHMADMYYNLKSWDECYKWLKKTEEVLTENDNYYGYGTHNKLGWSYYLGRGCAVDEQLAVDHFLKEFEFDPVRGYWDNALVYLLGMNGEKSDCIMALNLLNSSVVMLRWPLIYAIEFYLENSGTVSDETWQNYLKGFRLFTVDGSVDEAIPYLEMAVNNGFFPAYKLLGDVYLGKGNIAKAIEVVAPASDANYAPTVHQHGYYVERSTWGKMFQWDEMQKAASLYMKGAELNYPPSQIAAGYMHLNGYGKAISKNSEEAYKWFDTAIRCGEPSASEGKKLAIKAINKEAWQRIAQEVQNLGNNVEAIIARYTTKSSAIESNSVNSIGAAESNHAGTNSATSDSGEIRRNESFYKKYVSDGEYWIKKYNEAVADQAVCDAKDDWIGFSQAGDRKLRAIDRMKSILKSMEHHRQRAARAGGNIPVSDVEAAMKGLI